MRCWFQMGQVAGHLAGVTHSYRAGRYRESMNGIKEEEYLRRVLKTRWMPAPPKPPSDTTQGEGNGRIEDEGTNDEDRYEETNGWEDQRLYLGLCISTYSSRRRRQGSKWAIQTIVSVSG